MTVIIWDDAALAGLLNDPAGPVGQLIAELSERGAVVARAEVRVRQIPGTRRTRAGRNSTAHPPGYTRDSIHVHGPVLGSRGGLYGGVNSAGSPTFFLEAEPDGAEQMTRRYPFMSTALDSLQL